MVRDWIVAALLALVCAIPAEAQAPTANRTQPEFLKPDEIIRQLPGRWEYRPKDGWKPEMLKGSIRCSENAERIWFDRDAKGLVYHSQNEEAGSKPTTSRIGTDGVLVFQKPLIRIQYEGEKGWDKNGKPIIWEIWMPDTDTFHWRIMGWPPDAMMPPIRRCKDKMTS
jgi:hypothetical protein